jgi:hypothetical protein
MHAVFDFTALLVASLPSSPEPKVAEPGLQYDDIRTEFHPASGKDPVIEHFKDYGRAKDFAYNDPPNPKPWAPFESRLDFEIAELILLAALNREQTKTLISLFNRVADGREEFSLRSHDDIKKKWEKASNICTKVSHITTFTPLYFKSIRTFPSFKRNR